MKGPATIDLPNLLALIAAGEGVFLIIYRLMVLKSPLWHLANLKVTRLRKQRHVLLMERRAARNMARSMRRHGV
jgi:hypothetical protein